MVRVGFALLALVPVACGGSHARGPAAPRAAAEADYPALRWVAANAPYALVAAHAGDLAQVAGELVAATGLFADFDRERLDDELRQWLGASPLERGELGDLGIDADRSAAIFGLDGIAPAAMVPVADPARLRALLDRVRPSSGLEVERFRGIDVYTYRDDIVQVSWAQLNGWLALRFGPRGRGPNTAWLGRILDVPPGRGLAVERDLADARARVAAALGGTRRPDVLGLVRWDRLLAGLPFHSREIDDCRPALGTRAMVGANVTDNSAHGAVVVELSPVAARELGAAIAPPPPPGYRGLRDAADLQGEVDVDLAWVASLQARSRCALAPPLSSRDLATLGSPSVIGWRVAASQIRLDPPSGRIAVHLSTRGESWARSLLDQIPMRSLMEHGETVAGVKVRVIEPPLYPRLTYRLAHDTLTATVGQGVMERMLSGKAGPAEPGRTVLAGGLRPGRLPGAGRVLSQVALLAGLYRPAYFQRLGRRLQRYDYGWTRLSLEGDDLVLRLGMGLR